MNDQFEDRLWGLLEKEQLASLSQFHQPGFFDEFPLFSRESDVDFLTEAKAPTSAILLRFALKFLRAVVAYEKHPRGYFAAVTMWSAQAELLVPNLFVWCGDVQELKEKLTLDEAGGSFSKTIKKLVSRLQMGEEFELAEDNLTLPGQTRLFIAPKPPYAGFATLSGFRKQRSRKVKSQGAVSRQKTTS